MKNWRPPNWKTRHLEVLTNSPTFNSTIYEDGADALLEAVVHYLEVRQTQYWSNSPEGISRVTFKLPENWQKVFIPDDD